MLDHQLQIGDVLLGSQEPLFLENLDTGSYSVRTQDVDSPTGDSRFFGRDLLTAPTWSLDICVNEDSVTEGLVQLGKLSALWDSPEIRNDPGAQIPLTLKLGDEERTVWGRPGSYSFDVNRQQIHGGFLRATLEFRLASPYSSSSEHRSVTLTLFSETLPGLIFPAEEPFVFGTGGGLRTGQISNSGSAPAPFIVEISGPVQNPVLKSLGGGWELGLSTTLAYDELVTIDTRTMTVVSNLRGSLAGALTRRSSLRARIPVGESEFTYSGIDPSNSSTATVSWSPTYAGL